MIALESRLGNSGKTKLMKSMKRMEITGEEHLSDCHYKVYAAKIFQMLKCQRLQKHNLMGLPHPAQSR